jgi:hypothetical protein
VAQQPSPEALLAGYNATVVQVRQRITAFAATVWASSSGYRDADVDRLVALIVPRVQAGQVQVAALTSSYLARAASLRRGVEVVASPVDRALVTGGRGVAAGEVYRRPAVEVYTALAGGAAFDDAVRRGARRLESLVSTDLQMAKVRQSDASLRASGATAYRRVLVGSVNCALCSLAATQRYRTGSLLPIHPGCNCGVDEIDPAAPHVLDPDAVEAIHARVADEFGTADRGGRDIDYRLIHVREHGEFGPTLSWRGQHFDGPAAVA